MGIGNALALKLADQEANLVLASRATQQLEELKSQCIDRGASFCEVIPTDVTSQQACQNLIERTMRYLSKLDMLIYTAGIGMRFNFEDCQELGILERIMQVNFWGFIYCIHHALPYIKNSHGRVVVLSSLGGIFPTPHASFYAASKHAIKGFCDTLRIEEKDNGVSITVVYPEWVQTGISSRALDKEGNPAGSIVSHEQGSMSVEKCVNDILIAADKRKRELIWPHGRMGMLLNLLSPTAIDQVAVKTFSDNN